MRGIGVSEGQARSAVKTAEILLDAIAEEYVEDKVEYLNTLGMVGRLRHHSMLISSYGDLVFLQPKDPALTFLHDQLLLVAQNLEAEMIRLRKVAWEDGSSLDDIDKMLQRQKYELPELQNDTEEGTLLLWRKKHLATEARAWRNQTDRINAWLLQCLESSTEQADLHHSYLPKQLKLDDDQWARQVFKFWPLDEAAIWLGDRICSTNGAVDSEGAAHSQRVFLRSESRSVRPKQSMRNFEELQNEMESLESCHTAAENDQSVI